MRFRTRRFNNVVQFFTNRQVTPMWTENKGVSNKPTIDQPALVLFGARLNLLRTVVELYLAPGTASLPIVALDAPVLVLVP